MKGWKTRLLVVFTVALALVLAVTVPAMADLDPIASEEDMFGSEGVFGSDGPVDWDDTLGPDDLTGPDCSSMPYVLDAEGQYVCSNNPFTVTQPDGSTITVGPGGPPLASQTG